MSSAPLQKQTMASEMEEDVGGSGQEEQNADDPAFPGASVVAQIHSYDCQEPSTKDQDLPIMHWEDLSLRIAELERQEKERSKKAKCMGLKEQDTLPKHWPHDKQQLLHRKQWENDDLGGCRFPFITSRFTSPKNLQLCFINNTESDQEDDEGASSKESQSLCNSQKHMCQSPGLKQEVRETLSQLRDKLWAEQKQKLQVTHSDVSFRRRKLSLTDLQTCSVLQLNALSASLHEDIQELSSELVKHLVVRDHLRTKQDALLLDVQDMTSL